MPHFRVFVGVYAWALLMSGCSGAEELTVDDWLRQSPTPDIALSASQASDAICTALPENMLSHYVNRLDSAPVLEIASDVATALGVRDAGRRQHHYIVRDVSVVAGDQPDRTCHFNGGSFMIKESVIGQRVKKKSALIVSTDFTIRSLVLLYQDAK